MKVKRMLLLMLVLFSVVPMVLITGFCVGNFTRQAMGLVEQNIQTAAQVQATHLQNFFEQQQINMRGDSEMPEINALLNAQGEQLEQAKEISTQRLRVRVQAQSFLRSASIVGLDNTVIVSTDPARVGRQTLVSDQPLSVLCQQGFAVEDIREIKEYENGVPHTAMVYPITEDGQLEGFLVEVMDMSYFERMLLNAGFFETGTVTVLDCNGRVAASSSRYLRSSIYELQESDLAEKWDAIDLDQTSSGTFSFSIEGKKRLGCYSELLDTGWSVLTVVDHDEVTTPVWIILLFATGFLLVLLLLIFLSSRFVHRFFSHPLEQIVSGIEQMRRGEHTARIHYTANNEFGKISAAFNELMDHIEEDNRYLRASETRYRLVVEQADNIIFEYNIQNNTIYHSANWRAKFGYDPVENDCKHEILAQQIVHEEDRERFTELFEAFEKGERLRDRCELRLRKADGSFLWCSIQATAMNDEAGLPYKMIGSITDIDRQKRETAILKDKAERDLLTGLYNRATTEALICRCLEESKRGQMHALIVVDIDDFKSINDNLGHLFGDAVLSEISAKLLSIFRVSDVVGRIGGDEFVVFLNKLPSEQLLYERLDSLIEVFRHSYTGENQKNKISGSIGAAIYPRDGKAYKELFANADSALYAAKHKGKDCYQLYDPSIRQQHYNGLLTRTLESHKSFQENVSEYIFQILYQTKDTHSAVEMILDIVGRYYNVSRAYVIEFSEDGHYMNNTFEWCNTGIEPQIDNLQHIDNDSLGGYADNFKESNVFYVKDIRELSENVRAVLEPQGICSMLQCAILDEGECRGYVGFDECNARRLWTQNEIDTLSFISKILSVFLLKLRTQNKLEKSLEKTRAILDTQDMWTYVVDRSSYELLFINRKTRELAPTAKLGEKCYTAFWGGRSAPCERCPIAGLSPGNDRCTLSIFNDHFRVWTSATASPLEWDGRKNVCLICCIDTTHLEHPPQEETK